MRPLLGPPSGTIIPAPATVRKSWAIAKASIDQVIDALGQAKSLDHPPADGDFTGRYHRGPKKAAVRLVVFHDYQCKDCARLDADLGQFLADYPTVSVCIRHYPLCSQCNSDVPWDFFHTRACDAAFLAEAAAALAGEEGFWLAHHFLFENLGKYNDVQLDSLAKDLGVELQDLKATQASESIRQTVASDIKAGQALGATGTPFVFLNSVEVRGTSSKPENVKLAIDHVLAEDPPSRTAAWDRQPPIAQQRLIAEWNAAHVLDLPPRSAARHLFGNPNAENRGLLFFGANRSRFSANLAVGTRSRREGGRKTRSIHVPDPRGPECQLCEIRLLSTEFPSCKTC